MKLCPNAILETVLYVDDLEEASDFYESVLGLRPVHADRRMKVLRVSEQAFLLLFRIGDTREPIHLAGGTIPAHDGKAGMHVAFSMNADEVAQWSEHLRASKVPIESTMSWHSGETSLYFRDPSGNLVELATPKLWGESQHGDSQSQEDEDDGH